MDREGKSTVTLKTGLKIDGSQMTSLKGQRFFAFKGIPYAEPPIGNLRFQPPVPKVWKSTHFCATKEIEAIQYDIKTNSIIGDEDCLVLNVFTQKIKVKRPVIVYIHGGAFITGSGVRLGPRKLLDYGLVLVTINYRLHAFGFLSTHDKASPGNYGMLDQIEALKWVQNNVECFGGDSSCITVIGQSAGACSAMHLMISPLAKNLFHRVVLMSSCSFCSFSVQRNPKYWTIKLAQILGFTSSNSFEIINFLRTLPADKITKGVLQLWKEILIPMGPVVDGFSLPEDPQTLFNKGLIINRVPVLIGATKDEGLHFLPLVCKRCTNFEYLERIAYTTALSLNTEPKYLTSKTIKLVQDNYFNSLHSKNEKEICTAIVKVISDAAIVTGQYHAINMLLKTDIQPYVYCNDYDIRSNLIIINDVAIKGVSHAEDLNFLFDDGKKRVEDIANNVTQDSFLEIWTNFVLNGVPSQTVENNKISWIASTRESIKIYHLNETITVETSKSSEKDHKIDFWLRQIPATIDSMANVLQV